MPHLTEDFLCEIFECVGITHGASTNNVFRHHYILTT